MNNQPTHNLYNVIDPDKDAGEDKRGIWTRIGAAWPHGDGKGFSITLDIPMVISTKTRLVLRVRDVESTDAPVTPQSESEEVAAY